jgi:hypothetical protein
MTARRSHVDIAIDLLLDVAHGSPKGRLFGKVLGLVGYGALGRGIARRAVHCGMEVLYSDPEPGGGPHKRVLLGELLARSDYVMLLPAAAHPLPRDTDFLPHMKPGAQVMRMTSTYIAEHARQPHHDAGEGDHQGERDDQRADEAPALADDLAQWNAR